MMKWYEEKTYQLDFTRPIIAEDTSGDKMLLVPRIEDDYLIVGYDWLRLKDGRYNSCTHFKTAEGAIKSYTCERYKLYNAEIVVEADEQ